MRRFDLIGFDPRGVGHSKPVIACDQTPFPASITQFPHNQAEYDRLLAHNQSLGKDCLHKTGPLLEHVDTISVARDLEAIRLALGEGKLNYYLAAPSAAVQPCP